MTPQEFTYWLQGYAEIAGEAPSEEQWKVIKDHLQLVFQKVTPVRDFTQPAPLYTEFPWSPPHEVRCATLQTEAQTLC